MKTTNACHFIFGYGSLICPLSREITSPSLGEQEAIPVTVNNVERTWSARTKSGYTAMGVRFRKRAKCTGVLLEVNSRELSQMDIREKVYDRRPVDVRSVEKVAFLGDETTDSEDDDDNLAFPEKLHQKLNIWIYVQKEPCPPDVSHPIPQSYVDIIMRGCLSISPDFARSFIDTTNGWHAGPKEARWFDDRSDPIYVRADPEYSSKEGGLIDELLEECIPEAFERREEYDAYTHKSSLEQVRLEQQSIFSRD
jgi:Gamma-glutamyl cyclotransferase, AIG2-like